MLRAFLAGLGLGLFVAAQVGPVSLLCIRTATRSGFRSGLSVGLGAAIIDLLYATLGVLGVATLIGVTPVRIGLGVVGTVVLIVMGVRTLHAAARIRMGAEASDEVDLPSHALRTGLIVTASNPLTILSWAAIFGAAATASLLASAEDAALLLVGVGLGSAAWFTGLALVSSRAGSRMGPTSLAVVDTVSGVGLVVFGVVLGIRTLQDAR
jgi:threonine/homoserine/homoserine lactone efflux protein